jgi:regulator of sigma E protease
MSWVLAISGIVALIIIHEAGHFIVAKAVGMRVDRFSVFFPPKLLSFKRGETEYALGLIPAGGYVRIAGMSPEEAEKMSPEDAPRAFCNQAPWKRAVVILAGPGMNILAAFVLFFAVIASGDSNGNYALWRLNPSIDLVAPGTTVEGVVSGTPAATTLRPGDHITAVDGREASFPALRAATTQDTCPGRLAQGCLGTRPIEVTVQRKGHALSLSITPAYDASTRSMAFGFLAGLEPAHLGAGSAALDTLREIPATAASMVTGLAHALTSSHARKEVSSIVGVTVVTDKAVAAGWGLALVVLGFVSLTLGIINLFPFLPLDGGHVLWAAVEQVLGRRVSVVAMYRFSALGILLLVFLVLNGLLNDISRLAS